jgi:RIO-like serine/threonine protein kinase
VFQNLKGKHIALDQNKDVVIKIQPFEESKKEYEFQNVLKNEPGFIVFYCFVTLGIIVSPYYKNGSLEYFLQKYSKIDKLPKLKTILALLIASYYYAYKKYKFVHGDFYSKNILLDENYYPVIIDFEKSSFNHTSNIRLFWVDIQNLLDDVYRFVHNSKFNEIIRTHIVLNMAYNKAPTTSIMQALQKDILDL